MENKVKISNKVFIIILIILLNINCYSQNKDLKRIVNNLKNIKEMPYIPELSGDSLFWVVVKQKKKIIPYLIDKLDDTTKTSAIVPNFGGNYTVADVAYGAITKIIHDIPTSEFIGDKSVQKNGYQEYWKYTRKNLKNRKIFKHKVKKWYKSNKRKLVWYELKEKIRSASDWKFEENTHPSGGYYKLKDNQPNVGKQ